MTEQTYDPPMVFADEAAMTPVDEAVERVRAWLDGISASSDGVVIDRCYDPAGILDLTLGDLRALLSAVELGSVASLPVVTADEPATPSGVALLDAAEDEAYDVGKDDGYALAMQEVDEATGGDGEYRFCTNHDPDRHTPDAAAMKQRILDRFAALSASTTDSGKLDAEGGGL